MRLFFERLSDGPPRSIEEAVASSVEDLLTPQYASDGALPPGIGNFGVPRVIDVFASPQGGPRYAEMVRARLLQFEPRLVDPVVEVVDDRLKIVAMLKAADKRFEWIGPWYVPGE